jgi:GNAT superfamily N-acetyltransferase
MIIRELEYTPEAHELIYYYCLPYLKEGISKNGVATFAEFCHETTWNTFYNALSLSDYHTFAAFDGDEIKGVCIVAIGNSFFKGYEGDIDFFYIHPDHRGSGSSRELVKACKDLHNRLNLNVLYAGCASYIGDKNNKMYTNLYTKQGFVLTGNILHYTGDK